MRICVIEPYFGGSHKAFVEGLCRHVPFSYSLITMPPRKWKWRMRGAAIEAATRAERMISNHEDAERAGGRPSNVQRFNAVIASSMLNVAEFKGLTASPRGGLSDTPLLLVMHENQIAYPAPYDGERDIHFALTNLTSCLAADRIAWNSAYNRDTFLEGIEGILRKMPDERPKNVSARILEKSTILPPGIEPDSFLTGRKGEPGLAQGTSPGLVQGGPARTGPARILWNHRWEHDKAPERFFRALERLSEQGVEFELTAVGESFAGAPTCFAEARRSLDKHIVTWGFLPERQDYVDAVSDCDIAVSTADHEFFGISMLEAAAAGCRPLLPRRLSYPEIFPGEYLYDDDDKLDASLGQLISRISEVRAKRGSYTGLAAAYSWPNLAAGWKTLIESL